MSYQINQTHDPNLKSWVESANDPTTGFPIQNLPFCIFSGPQNPDMPRLGAAIGDKIVDLWGCYGSGLFSGGERHSAMTAAEPEMNKLAADSLNAYASFRGRLFDLLDAAKATADEQKAVTACLIDAADCRFRVPFDI